MGEVSHSFIYVEGLLGNIYLSSLPLSVSFSPSEGVFGECVMLCKGSILHPVTLPSILLDVKRGWFFTSCFGWKLLRLLEEEEISHPGRVQIITCMLVKLLSCRLRSLYDFDLLLNKIFSFSLIDGWNAQLF